MQPCAASHAHAHAHVHADQSMSCFASTFPAPSTHSVRIPRPIQAIGRIVRAGIVARNALIARRAHSHGLPASCICRKQVNTSKHVSTALTSISTSQDADVSLPAAAESPSHLVHSVSFEAHLSRRNRPAAFASYRCLHSCRADTGVISNPPAPQEAPQAGWALGPQCLRGPILLSAALVSITATCPRAIGCACGHEAA